MMTFLRTAAACCVAAISAGMVSAGEEGQGYLTKDGKLAHSLEVRDVQGGFAGFTGTLWKIDPSGKWEVSRVLARKNEVQATGELSKEQLADLAKELARYDLAKLPARAGGRPMANPHVVTITFGKQAAELTLGAGQPLPKVDPATVEGRFAGVVAAVRERLKGKKEPAPNGK